MSRKILYGVFQFTLLVVGMYVFIDGIVFHYSWMEVISDAVLSFCVVAFLWIKHAWTVCKKRTPDMPGTHQVMAPRKLHFYFAITVYFILLAFIIMARHDVLLQRPLPMVGINIALASMSFGILSFLTVLRPINSNFNRPMVALTAMSTFIVFLPYIIGNIFGHEGAWHAFAMTSVPYVGILWGFLIAVSCIRHEPFFIARLIDYSRYNVTSHYILAIMGIGAMVFFASMLYRVT